MAVSASIEMVFWACSPVRIVADFLVVQNILGVYIIKKTGVAISSRSEPVLSFYVMMAENWRGYVDLDDYKLTAWTN